MQFCIFTLITLLLLKPIISVQPEELTEVEPPRHPIRIEAHRGASRLAAENTLKAFEIAIDLGIDGIETDVWLSKDNIPILVHGAPKPNRGFVELENGLQNITEIESSHLKNYTLKNGKKILTLVEGLDICKDKINLNLELKDWRNETVDRVLDVIQEKNMLGQVSLSSFKHGLRKRLTLETERRKIESISFGYLSSSTFPKFPNYTITQPGDTINMDVRYLEKDKEAWMVQMNEAKKHGLMIKVWFPVTLETEVDFYGSLIEDGMSTIITNEPQQALDYFE